MLLTSSNQLNATIRLVDIYIFNTIFRKAKEAKISPCNLQQRFVKSDIIDSLNVVEKQLLKTNI